ncbi:MAG: ATP-dependent Clp protease proteolytic subunit [Thermoplasmatales archaeon]
MLTKILSKAVLIAGLICSPAFAAPGKNDANSPKPNKLVLDGSNAVVLRGEVTGESVAKLSTQILETSGDTLNLYISSPGGSIIAGMQLINVLKSSGKKVNCIASIAASMAFVILQACDTRQVMDSSILMQHVASYGLKGDAPNNLSRVKFIHKMLKDMDEAQASRLGMDLKEFRGKIRNDWWLFGKESVEVKAADNVIQVTCTPELAKKRITEKFTVFIFKVKVVWSGCPIIEEPLEVGLDDDSLKRTLDTEKEKNAYAGFLRQVYTRNTLMNRYLNKLK